MKRRGHKMVLGKATSIMFDKKSNVDRQRTKSTVVKGTQVKSQMKSKLKGVSVITSLLALI